MGEVSEIKQAFEIANEANLSPVELEDLEKREMFIKEPLNLIVRGRQEGMREKALEIAKQLLDVLDDQKISEKTGLTLEDIQQLRQG
jgi:predicted transposase/invertase (TIGR01784 family)